MPESNDTQAHLDRALDLHVKRAQHAIAHRLADARSHAVYGMPGLADRRLMDLLDALATDDGRGIVADARESAYRDAFRLVPFDPTKHSPAWQHPTIEGARAVRSGIASARREAATLIDRARTELPLIADDRDAIDQWHERHRDGLVRWAKTAISDHQVRVFNVVRHSRVKPELRHGATQGTA